MGGKKPRTQQQLDHLQRAREIKKKLKEERESAMERTQDIVKELQSSVEDLHGEIQVLKKGGLKRLREEEDSEGENAGGRGHKEPIQGGTGMVAETAKRPPSKKARTDQEHDAPPRWISTIGTSVGIVATVLLGIVTTVVRGEMAKQTTNGAGDDDLKIVIGSH